MKTWKTLKGEVLPIKEMKSDHIINAAKMLARNGRDWRDLFYSELRKRKLSIKPIKKVEEEWDEDYEDVCRFCWKPDFACSC